MPKSLALLLLLLTVAGVVRPSAWATAEDDADHLALRTLGLATAVAVAWQAGDTGPVAGAVDGCQLWQQPGVALVITETWQPAQGAPDLWLDPVRVKDFQLAQAELRFEEPLLFPRESETGADGLDIEPAVYLLNPEQAQSRLNQYLDNLDYWIELNPSAEFIVPTADECRVDAAVVFLDSRGPLEFYFQHDGDGALKLIHLIHYDFFSA